MEKVHSLIIEFIIDGWGSDADLRLRNRVRERLDERLIASHNGEVEGGDYGSGTMNIFLMDIHDIAQAVEVVLAVLEEENALQGTTIFLEHGVDEDPTVLWPGNFPRQLSLF